MRPEIGETGREPACRAVRERPAEAGLALRACSACAGDYENPDRTAWGGEEPNRAVNEDEALEDEFPVPEEHGE